MGCGEIKGVPSLENILLQLQAMHTLGKDEKRKAMPEDILSTQGTSEPFSIFGKNMPAGNNRVMKKSAPKGSSLIKASNEPAQENRTQDPKRIILEEIAKHQKKDVKKRHKKEEDASELEKDVDQDKISAREKDRVVHEDYARHTELYKSFHAEYMKDTSSPLKAYDLYSSADSQDKGWKWGDEVISFKERKELVRKIMLNSLMHGDHNHIDPQQKQAYQFWKYASKFNRSLSQMMYDCAMSYT